LKAHKRNQDQRIIDQSKKKLEETPSKELVVDKENIAPETPKSISSTPRSVIATPLTISSTLGLTNTPLPVQIQKGSTALNRSTASTLDDLNGSNISSASTLARSLTPVSEVNGLLTPDSKPALSTPGLSARSTLTGLSVRTPNMTNTPLVTPVAKHLVKTQAVTTMDSAQKRFLNKLESNTTLNLFELAGVSENSISINTSSLSLDEEKDQKLPVQQEQSQFYGYNQQPMYQQYYTGQQVYVDPQQYAQWQYSQQQQYYDQQSQQQLYEQYQYYQQMRQNGNNYQ
jgi:hypothetical protein